MRFGLLLLLLGSTVTIFGQKNNAKWIEKDRVFDSIYNSHFNQFRKPNSFLNFAKTPNNKRIIGTAVGLGGAYVSGMVFLDRLWYAGYPRSKFHWFNDLNEWNQIDKGGHIIGAYTESNFAYQWYRWCGANRRDAAIYGALTGFVAQSSIEIFDGFSSKWGASWSDIAANGIGSLAAMSQNLAWGEQRIQLKIAVHLQPYPHGELGTRANELFGTGLVNTFFKDYNNIDYWVCVNPWAFRKESKFPKWLNIAVGYGAGNLYGGFDNTWTDKNGVFHNRKDQTRYRKFFISIDYNLMHVKAHTRVGRLLLGALNFIKLPAPAIEFNTLGQVVFHPCYFLNMEMPIYLKK
ncbi:MAG: DUF2279 domain-containing protein [Chitinophagales bacterium]